uniref:Uncharacterized protein n=1 Tax=Setaria italica TaxID=4555 RepID=K3XTN8_SETIT
MPGYLMVSDCFLKYYFSFLVDRSRAKLLTALVISHL